VPGVSVPVRKAPAARGPQTEAGRILKIAAKMTGAEFDNSFDFDSLARNSDDLEDALNRISHTQNAAAAIDSYNATLDTLSSTSAGFGDSLNWACSIGCDGPGLRASFGITSGDADKAAYWISNIATTIGTFFLPVPKAAPAVNATKALPAAPKVEAAWGAANNYRHGGVMSTIEHINYRHAFESGFSNVGRFAENTSVRQIRGYVDDALRYGKVTPNGTNGYMIEHSFGPRIIGTNQAGGNANNIRIYVRDGIIQTAFPF
ncbi:MAG TPA: hypothetical protein VJS17_05555, partial [Pyrinomonadaceae bacterium]|nr:hypothetical protein [Pyrinomonadaceae bacterium]